MNGNTHAITRKKAMASLGFVTVCTLSQSISVRVKIVYTTVLDIETSEV